ncbi:MAG: YebC/PmpR family DNA-binding transcriptional regulator [Candidatus Blackburnbacteria bacterium]|nr:YebC/PmpR family DNA-binding transcriptional regulator [Candidatus Blackburnbacteria bacterium]
MSGHSKWSTIKHQKEATDAKRGQLFSKLSRAISIAAKQGGPNPDANLRLRVAIEQAKSFNMPKENIERVLKQVQEKLENLEEAIYEAYGPGGVGILIEAATDNRNRTTQEIKNILERGGGSLGTPGSVAFQFEQNGLLLVDKGSDPETRMLSLIDLGAEDVEEVEDGIEIYTKPGEVFTIKENLEREGINIKSAELIYNPKNTMPLGSQDMTGKILKLIEALDEHDDVQKVYTNADIN